MGIGAKILYDEVGPKADPLGPNNKIIFGVGPFQGLSGNPIPGSGRWVMVSKSPLTGIFGESCVGGDLSGDFKRSGLDGLVVEGRADSPVYLWLNEEKIEIKDASDIWGKKTSEAAKEIKEKLDEPKAKVACIGLAGENLVRFACVINNHGVGGRSGMGAVMGSKNLKAVVAKGTKEVEPAKPEKLDDFARELYGKIAKNGRDFGKTGTVMVMEQCYELSEFGMRNWTKGTFEKISELSAEKINKKLSTTQEFCVNCPIGCHRKSKVEEPKKYAYDGTGPEYETVGMMGPNCLIGDAKAIGYMGNLCDEYGIDTITMGSLIGFLMESYEKGWITKKELDGIEPEWGDADSAIDLIKKVAKREGFGSIMGEGIVKTAKSLGSKAAQAAIHVKGMDIPAHDPRAVFSWAFTYATGPGGARHQRGPSGWMGLGFWPKEFGVEEQDRHEMIKAPFIAAKYQDWAALCNSLVQCEFMVFGGMTVSDQIKLLNYVTGREFKTKDVMKFSERIFNLQRMFSVKHGVSRKDDTLPSRMFEPLKEGGSAGVIPTPFEKGINKYYKIRGWDKTRGVPTKQKLRELGLEEYEKDVQF